MKAVGHQLLGHYLVDKYMSDAPRRYVRAFLLGCVEPDKNPATYLKGSIRHQWLRGHNWDNSQQYIQRLVNRLEGRQRMYLVDYYMLGKLIHYTTDAFTYAHNASFPENLRGHCNYEKVLQNFFSQYIHYAQETRPAAQGSVMDTIRDYHEIYESKPTGVYTDSRFSVSVCCNILYLLLADKRIYKK